MMPAEPVPTAPPQIAMTDLEERLQGPDGSAVCAELLSRLAQLDGDVGAMIRHGLTREEFQRAQAVRGAVQAARNFLAKRA